MSSYGAVPKSAQVTVGVSAVQLLAPATVNGGPARRSHVGLSIKALATNTDTVWVGQNGGTVTTGTGYPLAKGESLSMACDDPSLVWAISGSANQVVAIVYA